MRSEPVSELGRCLVDCVVGITGAVVGVAVGSSRVAGGCGVVAGKF